MFNRHSIRIIGSTKFWFVWITFIESSQWLFSWIHFVLSVNSQRKQRTMYWNEEILSFMRRKKIFQRGCYINQWCLIFNWTEIANMLDSVCHIAFKPFKRFKLDKCWLSNVFRFYFEWGKNFFFNKNKRKIKGNVAQKIINNHKVFFCNR